VDIVEHQLIDPFEGILAAPVGGSDTGVLVLAGSGGRVEYERCRLLARAGVTALSIRWFGGPGQPRGICEVPLETFTTATDLLRAEGAHRVGVMGLSKGAEAALLLAVLDPRVDAVVALSPTSSTWANLGPGRDGRTHPYRSSWTWHGHPLPFVPYDDAWTPDEPRGTAVAVRGWYERSLRTYADRARAAAVPVEEAEADILLVAGGADAMWPSVPFAEELAARRRAFDLPVRVITHPDAGHRPRLPGEGPLPGSARFRYGGSPQADAALGAAAWPHMLTLLRG
jgi:dienelactone hydrolase